MHESPYMLTEADMNRLLEYYSSNPGYPELESYVTQFEEDMMAYAEQSVEWDKANAESDPYHEPFEGEMDFDRAVEVLNAPGWGYTTDALDAIGDFISNVSYFVAAYDPDYPDEPVEIEKNYPLFSY